MTYRKEIMNAEFTKHLFAIDDFGFVVHHFTDVDKGNPHDHPFRFRTHILKGSYIERIYTLTGENTEITRLPGTTHIVEATCIHEIIALPDGDCWTLIIPEEKIREPGFWRFENGNAFFRQWNGDWSKIK